MVSPECRSPGENSNPGAQTRRATRARRIARTASDLGWSAYHQRATHVAEYCSGAGALCLGRREHAGVEKHLIAMADETTVQCGPADRPFVCTELYAGNERAHRQVRLPGLEADVSAL